MLSQKLKLEITSLFIFNRNITQEESDRDIFCMFLYEYNEFLADVRYMKNEIPFNILQKI